MAELLNMMLAEDDLTEDAKAIAKLKDTYDSYEVALVKSSVASTYGFGYRCVQINTGLIITVMCQGSIIEEWNKSCDLVDTICVGDRIIEINGKVDAKDMVKELKGQTEVKMKVLKSGPRWHLDGATAECMRKIEWAMAKGLHFETRSLEEQQGAHAGQLKVLGAPQCLHYCGVFTGIMCPIMVMLVCLSDIFYGVNLYSSLSDPMFNMLGNGVAMLTAMYTLCLYLVDWSTWRAAIQKYLTAAFCLYGFCFAFLLKCRWYPFAPLIIVLFHLAAVLGFMRATLARNLTRAAFYKAAWRCGAVAAVLTLGLWICWMAVPQWEGSNMYNDATKARLAKASEQMYKNVEIEVNGRSRSLDYIWDCPEKNTNINDFDFVNNFRVGNSYILTKEETNDRDKKCAKVKTIWFLMWVSPFIAFMTLAIVSVFCFLNTWDYTKDSSGIEKLIKGAILGVCSVLMLMWVSASVAAASMSLTQTLMAFCASAMMALMIWCYLEIGKRAITSSIKESKMMQMLIILATSNWVRAGIVIAFNIMIPFGFLLAYLNQKVRKLRLKNTSDSMLTDGADKVLKSLQYWNWGNIFIKVNLLCAVYWLFFVGVSKWTYVFLSWLNEFLSTVDLGVVIVIFFIIGFTMFLLPPVPGVPVYITSGVVLGARCSSMAIGFWGGIAIASALSFVLKLTACSGQYMIGYFLGKSIKIQQMVGVDKVFMRGVEKILLTRGFSKAKVSVLVGGPDWPTSVICGILRLNLCQILLGTTPVIFVSSPCVLAGAFLSGPGGGTEGQSTTDDGIYSTLSSTMLAASVALQGGSMLMAAYYIQDVLGKHSAELNEYRPEHAPVMALTQKEAESVAAWNDVLHWHMLSPPNRVLILVASAAMMGQLFLFGFMDEACHKPFQVNKSIKDPEGQGGLDGNALSIVLPLGWFANGLFVIGLVLHSIFVKLQGIQATKHLQYKRDHPSQVQKKSVRSTPSQKSQGQKPSIGAQSTGTEGFAAN